MGPFGPNVGHADHQVVHHLPVYVQIPSLDVSGATCVSRNQDDAVLIVLCTWGQRPAGREDVCYAVIDLGGAAVGDVHCLAIKETESILVGKGSFLHGFVKNAVAAPDHGLIIHAVSKPEARSECLVVDVLRAFVTVSSGSGTKIGVSAKDIPGVRVREVRIDGREAIKSLACGEIDIVAKSVIQS